jgi:hypothetical protein
MVRVWQAQIKLNTAEKTGSYYSTCSKKCMHPRFRCVAYRSPASRVLDTMNPNPQDTTYKGSAPPRTNAEALAYAKHYQQCCPSKHYRGVEVKVFPNSRQ